ncbi:MAG TPA: DUF4097 family beta strand repeat-containing protein [Mycobacteriales bacterium]|nr:DUF4097 family beta strand repeat-containing protein [Mycobacteriales bacterium]
MTTNTTGTDRPGRTGHRAAWLAIGVPLTGAALFFGSLNVVALVGSQSDVENHVYRENAVVRLDVAIGSGDIEVRHGPTGQVTVRRRLTWAFSRPAASQRISGATLFIRTNCGFRAVARCSSDYLVTVPADVAVHAHTSSGTVTVDGVGGGLDLSTSSGDIRVRGGRGALLARTGSGSIEVTGSASQDVSAHTGSGDAALTFDQSPRRVDAQTGSGDVDVAVPGRDRYRVTGDTGSGDRSINVIQDPDANRSIRADTGSGDVTVRYLDG